MVKCSKILRLIVSTVSSKCRRSGIKRTTGATDCVVVAAAAAAVISANSVAANIPLKMGCVGSFRNKLSNSVILLSVSAAPLPLPAAPLPLPAAPLPLPVAPVPTTAGGINCVPLNTK